MKTLWVQRLKLFVDMSWHAMGLLQTLLRDQGDRSMIAHAERITRPVPVIPVIPRLIYRV